MTNGKAKVPPIEVSYFGLRSTTLKLEPDDFVDLVTGKELTVIRARTGISLSGRQYVYYAVDGCLIYYTKTKKELPELRVDFIVKRPVYAY